VTSVPVPLPRAATAAGQAGLDAILADPARALIATVPADSASRVSAAAPPGAGAASAGSATIGASVPSKSVAISARAGSARIASRPAWPSGVAARGKGTGTEVTADWYPAAASACAAAWRAARAAA